MKNKNIAALLSLLFPGLGQLYIGKWVDGIVFLVAAAFIWIVILTVRPHLQAFDNPRALIIWLGLISIYLYSIIDAYRKTK